MSPMHERVCVLCGAMTPGIHVNTADVAMTTITQSATTPAARIRINRIVDLCSPRCQSTRLTGVSRADHNHHVMHSLRQTGVALALAPWLVLSSAVPPEHVHEADARHSHAVAHRHFAPHDQDGAEISDGEGRVVWLDDVGVQQAAFEIRVAQTVVAMDSGKLPEPESWVVISTLDAAPPHGPPRRCASLRGPPCLSI